MPQTPPSIRMSLVQIPEPPTTFIFKPTTSGFLENPEDVGKRWTTHTIVNWSKSFILFFASYPNSQGIQRVSILVELSLKFLLSRMYVEHDGKCHGYFLHLPFLFVNRSPAFFSCLRRYFHAVLSLSLPLSFPILLFLSKGELHLSLLLYIFISYLY